MYKSYDWRTYSIRFLKINDECYACGTKPSQVVDHLRPALGKEEWFWREANYIPLCTICHNTVTSKFDRYYKDGDSLDEKIKWLNKKRIPSDEWIPKAIKVIPIPEKKIKT